MNRSFNLKTDILEPRNGSDPSNVCYE